MSDIKIPLCQSGESFWKSKGKVGLVKEESVKTISRTTASLLSLARLPPYENARPFGIYPAEMPCEYY